LSRYGDWLWFKGQYVWVPEGVDPSWRPYTLGRWVYGQRYGRMWVSSESFGWAVYHYGRWVEPYRLVLGPRSPLGSRLVSRRQSNLRRKSCEAPAHQRDQGIETAPLPTARPRAMSAMPIVLAA
jgi:hypothetical protein